MEGKTYIMFLMRGAQFSARCTKVAIRQTPSPVTTSGRETRMDEIPANFVGLQNPD